MTPRKPSDEPKNEAVGWASTFRCECGCMYAVEPIKDADGEFVVQVTRMGQPPCRAKGACT